MSPKNAIKQTIKFAPQWFDYTMLLPNQMPILPFDCQARLRADTWSTSHFERGPVLERKSQVRAHTSLASRYSSGPPITHRGRGNRSPFLLHYWSNKPGIKPSCKKNKKVEVFIRLSLDWLNNWNLPHQQLQQGFPENMNCDTLASILFGTETIKYWFSYAVLCKQRYFL